MGRSAALTAGTNEVHVWKLQFGPEEGVDDSVLSADEKARAARFHFERHRRRFVFCRTALRELLGSYLSSPPAVLQFDYDEFDKPSLKDGGDPRLHFNLSHSGNAALIAFSYLAPVGVDVEHIRDVRDLGALAARIMTPAELARYRDLPEESRARAFFTAWTRKEAVLKAQGVGLSGSMSSIDVTSDAGPAWQVRSLDAGAEHLASLAVHTLAPFEIVTRDSLESRVTNHG